MYIAIFVGILIVIGAVYSLVKGTLISSNITDNSSTPGTDTSSSGRNGKGTGGGPGK
jgi:hypothetical protein